jgi:hypothetical protein
MSEILDSLQATVLFALLAFPGSRLAVANAITSGVDSYKTLATLALIFFIVSFLIEKIVRRMRS